MCGIVGYIGAQQAQDILLDGLSRLEYRGYDSAGIAVMDGGIIRLSKAKGRLANLAARVASNPLPGTIGIGHTRWATHGEPNDINAHPHTDMKGHIAVVHNGIIENYEELRTQLKAKGCVFVSETDTEVIAHLLHTLYDGDMLSTILHAQTMLEGSYALCVLNAEAPDTLYCTRKDSPLVVGLSDGAQYVGSDIPALIRHTRTVELLDEREVAVLTRSGVRVYDHFGNERALKPIHVDWDVEAAEKGGYAHFMLKEIHEEPAALKKTFSAHVDAEKMAIRPGAFPISAEEANSLRTLTIVACGTAYHAGVVGKYVIEKLARLPVVVDVASEFRYRNPILGAGDCFLAISQSGETADTLAAMREAERLGAKVMALTNVVGSSIARTAGDCVMYTYAGPEIAVASTKAYITQVEMMVLLAIDLGVKRGHLTESVASELLRQMADIPALAACEEEKLHKLWEGLGYYSRVRNLQKAARIVCEQYGGQLPADHDALRALPGIGDYTAGAIASISFGLAVPAVDGNVLRVFSRLYNDPGVITEPAVKRAFTARVMEHQPPEKAGDYNQALMELGALVCVPNGAPLCEQCPLASLCKARRAGTALELPHKAAPKARRIEPVTVVLAEDAEGRFLLQQRPEKGLLAGLWQPLLWEGEALSAEEVCARLEALGLACESIEPLPAAKHIFSHIEWRMSGYSVCVGSAEAPAGCVWASREQLQNEYTLPGAFKAYKKKLGL